MWKILKRLVYGLVLANVLFVFFGKYFNPPLTITQLNGVLQYHKLQRHYIPAAEMGDNVKRAVIAAEDQKFYQHNGFDYQAMEKALHHNEAKKNVRGGSTISQQTAKNIFLWQGRSYLRKGLEAGYTFLIEKLWGKDIILERYLNSIEMGRGVFGVQAAAQYYFHKDAAALTKGEAAWIATILPNPQKFDPKNPSPYLLRKHAWILNQMRNVSLK